MISKIKNFLQNKFQYQLIKFIRNVETLSSSLKMTNCPSFGALFQTENEKKPGYILYKKLSDNKPIDLKSGEIKKKHINKAQLIYNEVIKTLDSDFKKLLYVDLDLPSKKDFKKEKELGEKEPCWACWVQIHGLVWNRSNEFEGRTNWRF